MPQRPLGKPVVRFAPSPTGYLHIGGARTALFNWAYARRHGGTFILRMEDTDVARSSAESTRKIIEDLQWLGLDWDEGPDPAAADVYEIKSQRGEFGPYFQSQRGHLYQEYLNRLVQAGRTYRCFKTSEQLKAEREAQKSAGRPMKYDPTESLNRSEADQQKLIAAGTPYVWRFRMPDKDITVPDLVLGDVTIKAAELEDFVIMKSAAGGSGPTFHFANVVDDATMQVTHVLRAQEQLMNTPKHVALFEALGLPAPKYAHMPLIVNPDNTKMSKREKAKTARKAAQDWLAKHGKDKADELARAAAVELATFKAFIEKKSDDLGAAEKLGAHLQVALPEVMVHDFQESGYLQEVILNYVTLLGWSPGGNIERFDLDFLRREFDLERLGKSSARFDRTKLLSFNADSIAKLPPGEFEAKLREHLATFHPEFLARIPASQFGLFAHSYQMRAHVLSEPVTIGAFFAVDDQAIEFDGKAVAKVLTQNNNAGLNLLRELSVNLATCEPWDSPTIHKVIEAFAAEKGKGLGDIAQPLRVAVSGGAVSPPIHDTLAILGKEATVKRIQRCINVCGG